ncbi:FAD-dependent oxidoreductase [Mucilaginibacter koreensis]
MELKQKYDVIIIGGSYAGLAAAMSLGRALKQVLIIDSEQPCNRQTPHSHNFITHDGATPTAIKQAAKEQVLLYPTVHYLTGIVTKVSGHNKQFVVATDSGASYEAKKLLLATGLKDIMPAIPGFAECWGISVIHCPYCHGYEYRNQSTGILLNGNAAFDVAKLINNWTSELTLFTNGKSTLTSEQALKLQEKNIPVVEQELREIVQEHGNIKHLLFQDGSTVEIKALYARPAFAQHSDIPAQLGCKLTETGLIETDEFKRTSVTGVYAAGDNSNQMRSVAVTVASGTAAGAMINHDMINESC